MAIILRLAWRNLWRHPRRTWLTASAIAFSTTLLVFMITIQLGSYDMMIDSSLRVFTGQLQIQRAEYLENPKMRTTIAEGRSLAAELRRYAGVSGVAARAQGFALVSSGKRSYGVPVIGVEPEHEATISTIPHLIKSGRYFSDVAAQEALIGTTLARNLKIKVGDELTLLGSGKDGSVAATILPVVGLFESKMPELDRHLVQLPLSTFQEVFGMGSDIHVIAVATPDLEQLPRTRTDLARGLPPHQDLVIRNWDELLPGIRQLIQADMVQSWFMYIILIVVVTFSILNTFLMAVLERTREFGIMLALGTTPMRIGLLVILESIILTLIGLAVGLMVGGAIALYFYIYGFSFPGMEEIYAQFGLPGVIYPQLSFMSFALGPAVIFLFTVAASLYPALRIRRMNAVEAMHAL